MKNIWLKLLIGGVASTTSIAYLSYAYFQKRYPEFVSLPGPFQYIGVSCHRIPNNTRFKIYYPTSLENIRTSNSQRPVTYFTDFDCNTSIWGIPPFILKALNNLKNSDNPMPCFVHAPINTNNNIKYPLLLFSHGKRASFDTYTQLLCGLASYGIIVAIIEHTDGSAVYTETYDNKAKYYEPGFLIDEKTGTKFSPKPWKWQHDIADYGEQRLKRVRVPEFLALYNYLTKCTEITDDKLCEILNVADMKNIIFGGQSFGGVTSWMAAHKIKDDALKCLLLYDPWFGCIDINELKQIKWSVSGYILSSEKWIKEEKYLIKLNEIVMNNGSHMNNMWEYAKAFVHIDCSDVPLYGPTWLTKCRKIYTAHEWSDILCKRSAAWIAYNIPELKERVKEDYFKYNNDYIVKVKTVE